MKKVGLSSRGNVQNSGVKSLVVEYSSFMSFELTDLEVSELKIRPLLGNPVVRGSNRPSVVRIG